MSSTPPSQNAFQRRYFAWAKPYYARMPEPLRHEVECLDLWLYSRAGLRFWGMVAAAIAVFVVGLHLTGVEWGIAVPGGLLTGACLIILALSAWLQPQRYAPSKLLRFAVIMLVLIYIGAIVGFFAGQVFGRGNDDLLDVAGKLGTLLRRATPTLMLLLVTAIVLLWGVATVRRFRLQKEMDVLRRMQEADAIARQLAEARLNLLQGQIQPHFIFNTLAAVQHWVDVADPRAGPLLRALTSFLRGSTELLAQPQVPLAVELATVRDYLDILAARLGDRLRFEIRVDERAAVRALPPGLLLTLVENAVEHGVAPALHGGTVTIAAMEDERAWTLSIEDDGVALPPDWAEGVGLRNCRERLAHRFGDAASLSLAARACGAVATLRIELAAFA